jgi:XTP/dITP diphosphohydrolase
VQQLLAELSATRDDERGASFQCAVAIVDPKGTVLNIGEGTCEGTIAREARGDSGFGYDPVFIPKGYAKTFAELSQDAKDRISHRAKALRITRAFLLEFSSRFKAATLDRDHAAS